MRKNLIQLVGRSHVSFAREKVYFPFTRRHIMFNFPRHETLVGAVREGYLWSAKQVGEARYTGDWQ